MKNFIMWLLAIILLVAIAQSCSPPTPNPSGCTTEELYIPSYDGKGSYKVLLHCRDTIYLITTETKDTKFPTSNIPQWLLKDAK